MKNFIIFGSIGLATSAFAAESYTKWEANVNPRDKVQNVQVVEASNVNLAPDALKDRFTTTEDHKLGSQIHVQIAEIIGAPNGNEIILIIDQGDVKLIGKVPSEEAKTKIAQAVQQIKGVKSVHNKLESAKK